MAWNRVVSGPAQRRSGPWRPPPPSRSRCPQGDGPLRRGEPSSSGCVGTRAAFSSRGHARAASAATKAATAAGASWPASHATPPPANPKRGSRTGLTAVLRSLSGEVAGVGEPAGDVGGGDGVQGGGDRGVQGRPGARRGRLDQRLDLAEGLLDRGQVRRVGRQEHQLAAGGGDQVADPVGLVGADVVHHDHHPRRERR